MVRRGMAGRRGPGVVRTAARTAVIAGTANATSRAVSGRMDDRAMRQQQEQAADAAALDSQAQIDELHSQLESLQAQQVQSAATPPVPPPSDLMTQIQQLAQLKDAGMLTDDEFQAAKAKLLAT